MKLTPMRIYVSIISFFIFSLNLFGQANVIPVNPALPESDTTRKIYTVTGQRHGISFFPKVRFPDTEYEAGDSLTFDRFHSVNVINSWLTRWAEKYPDLVDIYEAGSSFEGRPVLQMTLTSKKTGKDTDKPGAFFEGGRHSGEITSCESVMWLAQYLLENYDRDDELTHILDTKTIYLRPVNNPDGHNLYLNTAQSNRSTVRPHDNDDDGLLDEDPPEDLDGDGIILSMRRKDDKKGNFIIDPQDSTGRLMKHAGENQGKYLISSEGIDNDGDGRINEDGIGGLDLHRNYPENWRPRKELTGRGFTQGGAGDYPLSEPETRSVVTFLLSHPNVYVVNSMDTSVPMHLRPPSTSPSEERMYPEDLEWYRLFDEKGKKITGYLKAGDVYNDYGNGNPLFGHGPDFGYWYFGAIWYGDELWNGGKYMDYDNNGNIDELDILKWDEEENGGTGFHEWKSFIHPVYGEVETGGFDPKFFSQNPPAKHLEPWVKNQALFNIEMIKALPELVWENIEVKKIRSYRSDSADYQVRISFRNTGQMPTALRQAHLVKIVREDRMVLEFDTTGAATGKLGYKILPEERKPARDKKADDNQLHKYRAEKTRVSEDLFFTGGGMVTTGVFTIRVFNNKEVTGKASLFSTRGGVLRDKEFTCR